jgi:GNAT superfamily N-acetyltransferase
VQLRDGSAVLLRPVQRSDVGLLEEGFARLSMQSRRARFLAAKPALSAAELRYFTDIDHIDHEAIGALSPDDGRGVAVARYIRDNADPYRAELAVTVIDEWQRRGLGTVLLAYLSRCAHANGIRQFSALVAADNVAVIRLLRRMHADVELVSSAFDTMEFEIFLRSDPLH